MSVRALGTKLFKHGTSLLKHISKRNTHVNTTIAREVKTRSNAVRQVSSTNQPFQNQVVSKNYVLRNVGIQITQKARQLLVESTNKLTTDFAADLRKKATNRILYGNTGPILGLVGITVASGSSILTKEEELEGVCMEIRECMSKFQWFYQEETQTSLKDKVIKLDLFNIGKPIAKGANAVVYSAKLKSEEKQPQKLPLAIKMMFNYDIQSNAMAILRAMYKETVPSRLYYNSQGIKDWELEFLNHSRHLPPHPNIVNILSVFTDHIPELDECRELYPAALPRRIDPNGEGRNMSLFLLMKRYHQSLEEYTSSTELNTRKSVFLFTQLLEGITHMISNNIAHRDLKSDNILLDLSEPEMPNLVITDFGCCLAEKNSNLVVPYNSYDIDKGGNAALMAPEIINQKPGNFSTLNFTKSDLWAAGALAYEIFGANNPFYNKGDLKLRNTNYLEEDLPDLPENVPAVIQNLVKNLLKRNPNERLSSDVAATVCQLFLWAPSLWINKYSEKLPTSEDILEWLLNLTAKVLCEGRAKRFASDKGGYSEYLLISSFLGRAKLAQIKSALVWIQSNNG